MSNVPAGLRYAKSHEWLKLESDGTATVGITDYAQSSLGDITYVQLPKVGATFKAGETFGVVESVKAAVGSLSAGSRHDHRSELRPRWDARNAQQRAVRRRLDPQVQAGESR